MFPSSDSSQHFIAVICSSDSFQLFVPTFHCNDLFQRFNLWQSCTFGRDASDSATVQIRPKLASIIQSEYDQTCDLLFCPQMIEAITVSVLLQTLFWIAQFVVGVQFVIDVELLCQTEKLSCCAEFLIDRCWLLCDATVIIMLMIMWKSFELSCWYCNDVGVDESIHSCELSCW